MTQGSGVLEVWSKSQFFWISGSELKGNQSSLTNCNIIFKLKWSYYFFLHFSVEKISFWFVFWAHFGDIESTPNTNYGSKCPNVRISLFSINFIYWLPHSIFISSRIHDNKILAINGRRFSVNSHYLSILSPVLAAMFESDMKKKCEE